MDFRLLEGHIVHDHVLKRAVYVDSLTGIPNRFSVDQIFEKYESGADISKLGCSLIKIDTLEEPPMFQVTETHFAKTWLLDPRAPKIEKPEIIQDIHGKLVKAFNI